MRRFTYILLCFLMLFAVFAPGGASASRSEVEGITTPHIILMEADSGAVLYEKGARSKAYPASTTKIMTCLVALENCEDVNTYYVCGNESINGFGNQSSLLGLKPGYEVTVKDMLYGLMLCSGNDCGACLAMATSGSMESFIGLMNDKAAEIGMNDTHYTNAHGLQSEEHYTTAYDMALLMKYALDNPTFREIARTVEYTVSERNGKLTKTINTSNKLLYKKEQDTEDLRYQYCIAGKTGETNYAGYCFVAAAEKDGVTLIAVLLGDNNMGGTQPTYRFKNAMKLFDYGFSQFASYDLAHYNVPYHFNVQTVGYDRNDPENGVITAAVDVSSVTVSGTAEYVSGISDEDFRWNDPVLDLEAITAPVAVGDRLGTVTLLLKGEPFFTGDLVAVTAVEADAASTEGPADPNGPTPQPGRQGRSGEGGSNSRRNVSGLSVSKNGGEPEFTVWRYYKNTLYTQDDRKNRSYFLFPDGDVFRAASEPGASYVIGLYRRVESETGEVYYEYTAEPEADGTYMIVSGGKALSSDKKGGSLRAADVEFDEKGRIISSVGEELLWTFKENGVGYNLVSNGKYLHRAGGSGLLFWILIFILAAGLAVVIRLIVTGRTRRRNPRMKGKYKIYRM